MGQLYNGRWPVTVSLFVRLGKIFLNNALRVLNFNENGPIVQLAVSFTRQTIYETREAISR